MKMRYPLIALSILMGSVSSAYAQVDIDVQLPGISIDIDMSSYPDLVQVPDYPVYYNPSANANYFFYDGLYWVYQRDNWYASSWYNGPWELTQPEYVPLYVLRVPVRYYRSPPVYFRGWVYDAPPRWGDHWGNDWEWRHRGWDHWDRRAIPQPAPLPIYQRQYSGNRYPRAVEQQHTILVQNYRYQPREAITQQRFQPPRNMGNQMPGQAPNQRVEQNANPRIEQNQRMAPPQLQQQAPQQRVEQNQRVEQTSVLSSNNAQSNNNVRSKISALNNSNEPTNSVQSNNVMNSNVMNSNERNNSNVQSSNAWSNNRVTSSNYVRHNSCKHNLRRSGQCSQRKQRNHQHLCRYNALPSSVKTGAKRQEKTNLKKDRKMSEVGIIEMVSRIAVE